MTLRNQGHFIVIEPCWPKIRITEALIGYNQENDIGRILIIFSPPLDPIHFAMMKIAELKYLSTMYRDTCE